MTPVLRSYSKGQVLERFQLEAITIAIDEEGQMVGTRYSFNLPPQLVDIIAESPRFPMDLVKIMDTYFEQVSRGEVERRLRGAIDWFVKNNHDGFLDKGNYTIAEINICNERCRTFQMEIDW